MKETKKTNKKTKKNKNRKGFTLVELLAVIIILAIVVTIAIPAVMTTTTSAKKKALDTAVDTIKTYMQEQYELSLLGDASLAGDAYNADHVCLSASANGCDAAAKGILATTGYNNNISELKGHLKNGKIEIDCVTLTDTSDYLYSTKWPESKKCQEITE